MKVLEKIAFMVHEPAMYAHYVNVWAELNPKEFVIVLLGPIARLGGQASLHAQGFIDKVMASGYEVVYLDEIVHKRIKYRYVVSNHTMGASSAQPQSIALPQKIKLWGKEKVKALINTGCRLSGRPKQYAYYIDPCQYPPLQAGIRQIRFMYGADISDAWSLDASNAIYDLFLCHGPNDEKHLKTRFEGLTAIMGYPRYDGYFAPDLSVDAVSAEFDINPEKETLLWMPTFDMFKDDVCSIPFFARELAKLNADFNIVVRPHPISFRDDPAGIALLESLDFKIDRNSMRDMNPLFKLADVVLCDHGGSAFGALYLGKKLMFLKTPSKESATVIKGSSNLELMKYFPVLEPGEVSRLPSLMADQAFWMSKRDEYSKLSNKYFADYRGTSAKRTAEILHKLGTILQDEQWNR